MSERVDAAAAAAAEKGAAGTAAARTRAVYPEAPDAWNVADRAAAWTTAAAVQRTLLVPHFVPLDAHSNRFRRRDDQRCCPRFQR